MIRSAAIIAAGFTLALSAGWLVLPKTLYRPAPQPFAFNHQAHTGPKGQMACNDCHALRETGSFSGIPKLESCAACHAEPMGTTQAEKTFIANFVKPNREPQWQVYSRQPENAFFPHAPHVKAGKLPCEQCHADHGKSSSLPLYQANRITGYSRNLMTGSAGLRMDDCIACHQARRLSHSCLDCHK
jgi:hypothetical protein